MNLYLFLFLTFFEIGLFSFGGGYGMLPLMQEKSVGNGWLTESEFFDFLAVSESTPGPISINMATFIGSSQGGFLGAVFATLGVILPSLIVILLIVGLLKNFLSYNWTRCVLSGIKPVIVGLIFATGITLCVKNFLPNIFTLSVDGFNYKSLILSAVLFIGYFLYKKLSKKNLSPIILIISAAVLGIIIF